MLRSSLSVDFTWNDSVNILILSTTHEKNISIYLHAYFRIEIDQYYVSCREKIRFCLNHEFRKIHLITKPVAIILLKSEEVFFISASLFYMLNMV